MDQVRDQAVVHDHCHREIDGGNEHNEYEGGPEQLSISEDTEERVE